MGIKLQVRRGLKKDLPVLAPGEFGQCLDTGEVYIGSENGNQLVRTEAGTGNMLKSVYDTDGDGVVDKAESVPWAGVTGKPASMPANGGNADTVDGKHASDFVPVTGGTVNGQLAVTGNFSAGKLSISQKDGYLEFNDGGNREFFMHSNDGKFFLNTRKDGNLTTPLAIDENGICSINGASASTGVINTGNDNYTDGTHQVRAGWFANPSGRGPALCFKVDSDPGGNNVYVDRARFALYADADGAGAHIPSTYAKITDFGVKQAAGDVGYGAIPAYGVVIASSMGPKLVRVDYSVNIVFPSLSSETIKFNYGISTPKVMALCGMSGYTPVRFGTLLPYRTTNLADDMGSSFATGVIHTNVPNRYNLAGYGQCLELLGGDHYCPARVYTKSGDVGSWEYELWASGTMSVAGYTEGQLWQGSLWFQK